MPKAKNRPTAYPNTINPRLTRIADAIDAFVIDRKARGHTMRTVETYEKRLVWVVNWLHDQGVEHLENVTPTHIRSYFLWMQHKGRAAWTIHGQARVIKTFFRWLVADGWLEVNPMANVKMPKLPKVMLPAITKGDIKKLLAATDNTRDYALIMFLLDTGLRISECANLLGKDIDIKAGTVMVREGKGKKDRQTYIGAKTRKAMIKYFRDAYGGYPEPRQPVWVNLRNKYSAMTVEGLREILERLGRKAGVKGASPHAFRRTMALWSLRQGMSIYHLRRILGHEDLQVLTRYLDLVESDLSEAHSRFGAVDNVL